MREGIERNGGGGGNAQEGAPSMFHNRQQHPEQHQHHYHRQFSATQEGSGTSSLGRSDVPTYGERRASCDFCSRRKRKCDGQQPCQNCRKLKLVCHFSVKQKSGRKKKPRDDDEPKKPDAQSAKGRDGQGSVPAAGSGSASAAAKSKTKTKMEGGRAAAGAGASGMWMTKGNGGDFTVKCGFRSEKGSGLDGVGRGVGGDAQPSCDACKLRKRRCDGERPCGACSRLDLLDQCVYSGKRKATNSKPAIPRNKHRRDDAATQSLLNMAVGASDPAARPPAGNASGRSSPSPHVRDVSPVRDFLHGGGGPPRADIVGRRDSGGAGASDENRGRAPSQVFSSPAFSMEAGRDGRTQAAGGLTGVGAARAQGVAAKYVPSANRRSSPPREIAGRNSSPSPPVSLLPGAAALPSSAQRSQLQQGAHPTRRPQVPSSQQHEVSPSSSPTRRHLQQQKQHAQPAPSHPQVHSHPHGHPHPHLRYSLDRERPAQSIASTAPPPSQQQQQWKRQDSPSRPRQKSEAQDSLGTLSWSSSPTSTPLGDGGALAVAENERRLDGTGSRISPSSSASASSPSQLNMSHPSPHAAEGLDSTDMHEAEAAAARAVEAKARLEEAKARSEAAAWEAKEALEAAEVAREASTAVVMPLPATREKMMRDGRVGRRENAFLDTYFAFFGRFARLETESEARRTLIELALLQDTRPVTVAAAMSDRSRWKAGTGSGGGGDGGSSGASSGVATAASGPADAATYSSHASSSGAVDEGSSDGGGGSGGGSGMDCGCNSDGDAGGGSSVSRGGNPSGICRGVTPEKGASLWAGVGIGAMLQGASSEDGDTYAGMAREQLDAALEGVLEERSGVNGAGSGARAGPCGSRRQQRVRAELMLTVLYDMLGRYEESDGYLEAALDGVDEAMTHLRDVLDLLTAAKQEREEQSHTHAHGIGSGGHHHDHHYHHNYHHHTHHHHSHHHHNHNHHHTSGGSKAGSGGAATMAAAAGIGAHRQPTPMLITEGNALSLLNRLTWDTLRRFTRLPFAAASRGGRGGSSPHCLAEWRSAEGWYGTLTKAHSHLCADLNDDVRALPRCPFAVGLLKSKLSMLHTCLGRTTAAADKSQVMLALLEPFPGAGRWSLWRHPLHLAACHLAIAGRPGAYEKLRRTFNAFRLPGEVELTPFDSFYKLTQRCSTCSPTVNLLVKAYRPHLAPLLAPASTSKAAAAAAAAEAAVAPGGKEKPTWVCGSSSNSSSNSEINKNGIVEASGTPAHGSHRGRESSAAAAAPSSSPSAAAEAAAGSVSALGSGREHSPLGFHSTPHGAAASGHKGHGSGLARGANGGACDGGVATGGVAVVVSGTVGGSVNGGAAGVSAGAGSGGGGAGHVAIGLHGEAWKNQEENDNPIGMFGPGTRVMDRHLSFNDYQALMEMFSADQDINASLATPLDPIDDLLADWNNSVGDPGEMRDSDAEEVSGSEESHHGGDSWPTQMEETLFGYPNPNANFGPQFTPADDPAPADSSADAQTPSSSEYPAAAAAAAEAAAAAAAMLRQDQSSSSSFPAPGSGRGGVSVVCP